MKALIVWLALWLLCSPARAGLDCPALFNRQEFPKDTYYVLVFMNPGAGAGTPQQREQLVLMVEDRLKLQLAELAQQVREKSGATASYLVPIGCDRGLSATDLGVADLPMVQRHWVIAALWRSVDGVTYLNFSLYGGPDNLPRSEAEALLSYRSTKTDPQEAWFDILDQGRTAHEAFVQLGLARALVERKQFVPAWITLCESRNAFGRAAGSALRPPRQALMQRIGNYIDQEIAKVAASAAAGAPKGGFRKPAMLLRICEPAQIGPPMAPN